jgi:hypothetical protein
MSILLKTAGVLELNSYWFKGFRTPPRASPFTKKFPKAAVSIYQMVSKNSWS